MGLIGSQGTSKVGSSASDLSDLVGTFSLSGLVVTSSLSGLAGASSSSSLVVTSSLSSLTSQVFSG